MYQELFSPVPTVVAVYLSVLSIGLETSAARPVDGHLEPEPLKKAAFHVSYPCRGEQTRSTISNTSVGLDYGAYTRARPLDHSNTVGLLSRSGRRSCR